MRTAHARPPWRALAIALAGLASALPSLAQVTFYAQEGFGGRSYTTTIPIPDLQRRGFNDRASSAVVTSDRWLICEDSRFEGRCTVLRPGQYPSLAAMGLNNRVSSVRKISRRARVEDQQYAPAPVVVGDFRRRRDERLFQAPVRTARAVFGAPEQRCWMEREQVSHGRGDARMPGALLGAVIGGILGHQVGAGSGRDLATVGGVLAGGAVGSSIGRKHSSAGGGGRQVQRCADTPGSATPSYWDVTYRFRGQEHQVQLMGPPGPTITVNRQGEPRA